MLLSGRVRDRITTSRMGVANNPRYYPQEMHHTNEYQHECKQLRTNDAANTAINLQLEKELKVESKMSLLKV